MATNRVLITVRPSGLTCNCGCKGKDSWHAPQFRRVVHDVTPVRVDLGNDAFAVARGTARFPWGTEPVQRIAIRVEDKEVIIGWQIDKS